MSRDDNLPKIQKDKDYTSVYADDLYIKLNPDFVCSLMFYERIPLLNENETSFNKKYDKNLKFEVKFPLQKLLAISNILNQIQKDNNLLTLSSVAALQDEKMRVAWLNYSKELSQTFFDTNNPDLKDEELMKKQNYFFQLLWNELNKSDIKNESK